jgi:DNA-binding SARP family transcriptional activator
MSQRGFDKQSSSSISVPSGVASEGVSVWSLQGLAESPQLFEHFLYGLALFDREKGVLYLNRVARELLVPSERGANAGPWTCCELICNRLGLLLGGACMSEQAAATDGALPELRVDIDGGALGQSAWITASGLDPEGSRVLFHMRPGRHGDRRRRTFAPDASDPQPTDPLVELRVSSLGSFRVESSGGRIETEWFEQRPGELFKYLLCHRRQLVTADKIAEALWGDVGPDDAKNRLRYYVHVLRDKLEPARVNHSTSRFIRARRGGYQLDTDHIRVDADEFERDVRAGLAAFVQGLTGAAGTQLEKALRLYQGEFLDDDLYAEWAFDERERLHELAGRALRALIRINLQLNRLDAAGDHARQLAELEPFDTDVQRLFLDVCLRRGRRSEAVRRYSALRKRMLTSFGQEPDFDLPEVEATLN